jgi:hypothetical protein
MNELELVREMRADNPPITRQAADAGRARLLAAAAGYRPAAPPRRPRRRPVPVLAAIGTATATAVIAGAAAIAVVASGAEHGTPGPIRLDAVTVLDRAAVAVSSRPAVQPGPNQWIYIEKTYFAYGITARPRTDVMWLRADGRRIGFLQDGKLVVQDVPASESGGYSAVASYDLLAKLPTNPSALLADIAKLPGGGGLGSASLGDPLLGGPPLLLLGRGRGRNNSEFHNLAQLIWNSPAGAPPKVQAALYRAMALIPGITVDASARTITGQPAISLSGLLFNPRTYQMIGARAVAPAPSQFCAATQPGPPDCRILPAGTLMNEIILTVVKFVSGPGQR